MCQIPRPIRCPLFLQDHVIINQIPTPAAITTTTAATTTAAATTTVSHGLGFCRGKANGLYANAMDSNSYVNCWNGITYLQACGTGLVYRDSCKCCDWPRTGFCGGRPNGLYSNVNDNNSYYNCWNEVTYLQKCHAYLVFKASCNCCDCMALMQCVHAIAVVLMLWAGARSWVIRILQVGTQIISKK